LEHHGISGHAVSLPIASVVSDKQVRHMDDTEIFVAILHFS